MFRSIRFGVNEAHGRGVAIQMNYFLDNGGVTPAPDGTFAVNPARIKQNIIDLTRELMTMEAVGGYIDARRLNAKMAWSGPPCPHVLASLADLAVETLPRSLT